MCNFFPRIKLSLPVKNRIVAPENTSRNSVIAVIFQYKKNSTDRSPKIINISVKIITILLKILLMAPASPWMFRCNFEVFVSTWKL